MWIYNSIANLRWPATNVKLLLVSSKRLVISEY